MSPFFPLRPRFPGGPAGPGGPGGPENQKIHDHNLSFEQNMKVKF